MKKLITTCTCIMFFIMMAGHVAANSGYTVAIPVGGNGWVNAPAAITDNGLTNWTDKSSVTSIYFRVSTPQTLTLALRMRLPAGQSTISLEYGATKLTKQLHNAGFDTIAIGNIKVTEAGYIKINLRGISKTSTVFADVTDLLLKDVAPNTELIYVRNGSSFHFGRRGPSVHLRYDIPEDMKKNVSWFYNEITVPVGNDIIGSYFMADGFGEGYFGMQVNSPTERHILFSVWSPFNTKDPKNIPDSMKIRLIAKGAAVNAKDFGNEGSGGQSFVNYPWYAGRSYGFLLNAEPDAAKGTTTYTAWFKDIAINKWFLIASFSRPKTVKKLTSLYSFLENFEPDNGNRTRMAFYNNQWIGNSEGEWQELTGVTYTGDATARAKYRKDYAGGITDGKFYLKNAGFFNSFIPLDQKYQRPALKQPPVIDIANLPKQ